MRKTFTVAAVLFISFCLPFSIIAQEAQVDRTELPI